MSQKDMEGAEDESDDDEVDELEPTKKKMMMAFDRYSNEVQDDVYPNEHDDDSDGSEVGSDQSDAEDKDLEMESE